MLVLLALLSLGSASAAASTAPMAAPRPVGESGTWDVDVLEDTHALRTLMADYDRKLMRKLINR
jgi:hypothetical protein